MPARPHEDLRDGRGPGLGRDQAAPGGLAGEEGGFGAVEPSAQPAFHAIGADHQIGLGQVADGLAEVDAGAGGGGGLGQDLDQTGAMHQAKAVLRTVTGEIEPGDRPAGRITQFDAFRGQRDLVELRQEPQRIDDPDGIG